MATENKDYIIKVKMPDTTIKWVQDNEATHSINGYDKAAVEGQTVTFANQRIDETTDIDPLFTSNGGNN